MLDNTADGERVVEHLDRVAYLGPFAGLGLQIVDNQVVRLFERSATHEHKRAQGVVALEINAVDIFYGASRRKFDVDRRHHLHMRQIAEYLGNANISGSRTGHHHGRRGTGMHDHIHANPCRLSAAAVQNAVKDCHHRENHDDLDGDGECADDRAQGAMNEIAEDQFIHG